MSIQEMSGTNKLAQRILDDARADAEKTASDALRSVSNIRSEGEKKRASVAQERALKRKAAVDGVIDGCKTRASIDGRKAALARKRIVIDSVFEKTYQALLALDSDARGKILRRLLNSEAEGGETVLPAKADRALLSGLVNELSGLKLRLSDQDAPVDAGFILISADYEKDCSFAALLSELRDDEETNIATLLFQQQGGLS